MHRDRSELSTVVLRGQGGPRAHTAFGGSWGATGTAGFEVSVLPPSSSPAGWAVGLSNRLSKAPPGTSARVDDLWERLSHAELSARGTC
jgi:hypothetical protein